jgi:hypothetical protein
MKMGAFANGATRRVGGSPLTPEEFLEHRMGFEPMNTGFADQRVSHFAIGAYCFHLILHEPLLPV